MSIESVMPSNHLILCRPLLLPGLPQWLRGRESTCNAGDVVPSLGPEDRLGEEIQPTPVFLGFPGGSAGKESACNVGDLGSIPGLGRSPGVGNVYPLQYSGLENSMDCIVHEVIKSWTRLNDFPFHQYSCLKSVWYHIGFSGGSVVKNLPANAGDEGSIPESGRFPGEGNCNPLQYSCLGGPWTEEPSRSQFCSVAQLCLTLCDPMDCSTPGFPVLHYSLEFAQTYVHWVGDAIQAFRSLSPPSPSALSLSQHQGLFQ